MAAVDQVQNSEFEAELARQMLAGEAGAFERFVERYQPRIFHYSWLMCGQREDAEEVAQDTMLKALENLSQLRDAGHLKPWVFRIAKNVCLMKRRKSVFAPEHELSLDEPIHGAEAGSEMAAQIPDVAKLPDEQLLQGEIRAALEHAITQLPPTYRSVFLLRDVEGLCTSETAHILDLSEDVVKTRLYRGRKALRQLLNHDLGVRDGNPSRVHHS